MALTAAPLQDVTNVITEFQSGDLIFVERGGVAHKVDYSDLEASLFARDVGELKMFAVDTPPTGFLECDGSEVSRAVYASLFGVISTTWGVGNGTTTFNLPDFRGKFPRGWDNGAGVDVGRAFAAAQVHEMLAHLHAINITSGPQTANHIHGVGNTGSASPSTLVPYGPAGGTGTLMIEQGSVINAFSGNIAGYIAAPAAAEHVHANPNTDLNNVSHSHFASGNSENTGGVETRPVNETALICIRY